MKTFPAFFAALVLGAALVKCDEENRPTVTKEPAVVQQDPDYSEIKVEKPEKTFSYPEELLIEDDTTVVAKDDADLDEKRKSYFQESESQRKLSRSQRRRLKKDSTSSESDKSSKKTYSPTSSAAPTDCVAKSSKKSGSKKACVPVDPPVPQPVYIAPLAPVTQPVAAPVTVPFYVPVAAPASPPVGSPVAVSISFSSAKGGGSKGKSSKGKSSKGKGTYASSKGSSAPVSVQDSSSSVPIASPTAFSSAPVGGSIYVEATAEDCEAVTTGTGLVEGQDGMDSETFTFSFTLGTVTSTNLASVVATAEDALRSLVAQGVVNCSSSKGKKSRRARRKLHKRRRRLHRGGHNRHRQTKQHRRRHLLEENIVGNVDWDLNCVESTPCAVPGTCFDCTVAMTVFLKGPASDEDIEQEFQTLIDSPTFLSDSGLEEFASEFNPTTITHEVVTTVATDAGSQGDPHFKTWQGEHFEFHGQCDLVLAKDPGFAEGLGLDVQIRTKLVRYWSYIKSAAVRIGDDIVEVQGSSDIEDQLSNYWINFELQGKQRTIGGFPLTYFDDHARPFPKRRFEIDLSSKYPNQKIVIAMFKEFVKVDFVNTSKTSFGNTIGILGDYESGLTYARDQATVIHDFNSLGEEWQVRPNDDMMIFHNVEEPQFPKKCLLPEDPQGQRRRRLDSSSISMEEAEAACASLKDPLDKKDCVYDILATQDLDMVGAF